MEQANSVISRLENRLKKTVMGRDQVIDLLLIAILSDGHVLLEDYPGSGKTTLAKSLGESIIDDLPDDEIPNFRRVQFTPDLLPSDVTESTCLMPSTTNSISSAARFLHTLCLQMKSTGLLPRFSRRCSRRWRKNR